MYNLSKTSLFTLSHLTYWTHYVNKARFEFFPLFTCGFIYLLKVLRELWSEQIHDLPASGVLASG